MPPKRGSWADVGAIRGLSPAALAEIARIERWRNHLWPGVTGESLARWRHFVHQPGRRLWDRRQDGCGVWACCGDPWSAREYLGAVMSAMSRRRARELRALVRELDEHF